MTAKQFLKSGYKIDDIIMSYRDELNSVHALLDAMKRDGKADENTAALAAEIEAELQAAIQLKADVHNAVQAVKNTDERLVLRCRYVLGLTWEQTAERLYYSDTQVKRIHGSALKNVAVPERYKQQGR